MKKIKKGIPALFLGLLCIVFSNQAWGQEMPSVEKNIIKVKPLSFEFGYERVLNDWLSINTSARFLPIRVNVEDGESTGGYANYRLLPEARFYVASRQGAPRGFFVAPFVKAGLNRISGATHSVTDLEEKVKFTGTTLGGGFTMGWQWVKKSGFSIDLQFGWGYTRHHFNDVKVTYADGTVEMEPAPVDNVSFMLPRFAFSMGYAF